MIDKFRNSRLLKSSSYMMMSSIVVNVTRVLLIMILTRYYTQEEFGIWATITSTAAVMATGDFGVVNALRNKISNLIADGEDGIKDASRYFYTMMVFMIFISLILILLLFIMRDYLPINLLFKTDNRILQEQASDIFFWIQIMYILNIPLGMGLPLFFSFNETSKAALFTIVQACLPFIIIVALAFFRCDIVTISLFYFGVNGLVALFGTLYFIYIRRWYSYNITLRLFFRIVKEIFPQGLKFLSLQVGNSLLQNAGTICLSASIGVAVAGQFNVIQKIYTFFNGVYQSVLNPVWGELALSYAKKQADNCKKIIKYSMASLTVMFSIFMIIIILAGNWIIDLLAGSEYCTSTTMFVVIGLISYFYLLYATISTFQNATGHIWMITILNILAAGLLIPLSKEATNLGVTNIALCLASFWAIMSIVVFINANILIHKLGR